MIYGINKINRILNMIKKMNYRIKDYLSLIKFAHTIFAMPFALIGFFLAIKFGATSQLHLTDSIGWGSDKTFYYSYQLLLKFILVILCMIFARSAAMSFN